MGHSLRGEEDEKVKAHMVDKLLSFGLVLAGLVFLTFVPQAQAQNLFFVGILVVVGGVLGLVNAQVLAPVLQLLEKQLGIPLSVPSTNMSSAPSQAVLSPGGSQSTTNGVADPVQLNKPAGVGQ